MAKRPTRLDRDLGYGLQAHERPVKDDTETVDAKTTSTKPEAPNDTTEAEEIALLTRHYRQELMAQMRGKGTLRASTLAAIGKFLVEAGALDHKPGKVKQKPTDTAPRVDGLPFPVVGNEALKAEWKTPSR